MSQMKLHGCNASERTLKRIWAAFKKEGRTRRKSRSGRKRKCGAREERIALREALSDRRAWLSHVTGALNERNICISRSTLSRILDKHGFSRRGMCARPALNARQRSARLVWARAHEKWMACHWSSVVFSDEKIFRTTSDKPGSLITRKSSERFARNCVQRKWKNGPNVHVWGAIGWKGVGPLRKVYHTLNATRYQNDIIFDIHDLGPKLARNGQQNFIFQQDKAPAHFALSTRNFLANRGVKLFDWPGNSPDLNPTEHAWAYISHRLSNRSPPKSEQDAFEVIKREWEAIPLKIIRKWISSLPRRVHAVIGS